MIEQGKVREIGASNFNAVRLKEALEVSETQGLPRYQSLQPLYSLVERETFEGDLEELCVAQNVGVIGFYSLASGFLTGKYRSKTDMDGRIRAPRVEKYINADGFRVLDALEEVAEKHSATIGQVAIAWLIARPSVTSPIASATDMEQLVDLAAAVYLTLDTEDISKIDKASK